MKVVINSCFGGFSLSAEAEELYLKLKGLDCFFYVQTKYKHNEGVEEYKKVSAIEAKNYLIYFVYTEDQGDTINDLSDINFWDSHDIERNDPLLVQVVEQLQERANGRCAKLKVVDIPDNIDWEINEYDGYEHIAEKHKTWY